MTGSHLSVHLLNSTIQSSVTVFLVHVVITSSTLIPQPNPIILDCGWVLLKNLIDCQHLTIALLDFLKLPQKIPELGFGANLIRGPELHAVDLRMLIALRRESSPHNLVLVKPESNHLDGEILKKLLLYFFFFLKACKTSPCVCSLCYTKSNGNHG